MRYITRSTFDPNNDDHVEQYRQFLINSYWGPDGCPFECEWPFLSVTEMINNKLLHRFLNIDRKQNTFC